MKTTPEKLYTLDNMASGTKTIDDWPEAFSQVSHEIPIITLDSLKQAVLTNNFSKVNQQLVIPQAAVVHGRFVAKGTVKPRAVLFGDAQWSNEFCRASTHVSIRKANFKKIQNESMRVEAKVIAVSWLWFVTGRHIAKLASTIRKIENLILVYEELEKLGSESFFDTNNPLVAQTLIDRVSIGRNMRSARNVLMSADTVSLLNTLNLGSQYTSTTNFLKKRRRFEWDDSNQHYCIPFRIFMEYWRYYITKIDSEFSMINYKELGTLMELLFAFYERARKENWSQKKRADQLSLFCRDEIQNTLKKLAKSKWPLITEAVKLETSKRYANKTAFFKIYPQVIERWLWYIGNLSSHCVQTMTGMRDSERRELRLGGLIKDGDTVGVVTTYHKFGPEGGITDIYAAPQYIATVFDRLRKLYTHMLHIDTAAVNEIPLAGIHWMDNIRDRKLIPVSAIHNQRRRNQFRQDADIVITDDDLHEFKLLNPNINAPARVDKEVYVGASWPFKTHDSRRSIAVHLRRLDLVSTNDLVRQFKHFAHTQTEWYMSGFEYGGKQYQIAEDFSREIDDASAELSASIAMKFQNGKHLVGEGGKQLMEQSQSENGPKVYPSFKVAQSMAKRNKQHLRSLGNGFYCMNGQNCEYKPLISSAACNTKCPSMIADEDSIPIWRSRLTAYKEQLNAAIKAQAGSVTIEFLRLEVQFYEEALQSYGVVTYE